MPLTSPASPIWDDAQPSVANSRGLYIAVSGNTSAGKSTLIRLVTERAAASGRRILGISEREFHHPYLRLMFSEPGRFAFPVQLNFMLQRHMVLLRQLALGTNIFVERSHFDDALFVREHAEGGAITDNQVAAYEQLAQALNAAIPAPDLLLLVNPPAEVSLERLRRGERQGERPKEFPGEESQARWVARWHQMYESLHANFRRKVQSDARFAKTKLLELDPIAPAQENASFVWERIAQMLAVVEENE